MIYLCHLPDLEQTDEFSVLWFLVPRPALFYGCSSEMKSFLNLGLSYSFHFLPKRQIKFKLVVVKVLPNDNLCEEYGVIENGIGHPHQLYKDYVSTSRYVAIIMKDFSLFIKMVQHLYLPRYNNTFVHPKSFHLNITYLFLTQQYHIVYKAVKNAHTKIDPFLHI